MEHKYNVWLRARLTEKRYRHSLAVCERAVFLARLYGESNEKAELAGLLHDCCKCISKEEQLKIIQSRGIILDDFMLAEPQLWHGIAAAVIVEEELQIHDADVISAIRIHSTGAKNMTRLEQIIYLADLTSADREYPDVRKVRGMSEKSLTKSMEYCLKYIIGMLLDDGEPIVRETWEAYNYFWKMNKETGL